MKTLFSYLFAALLLGAAVSPTSARADVDIDFFYDSLAPHGSWMEVGDYGYVWRPGVDDDWEPYTNGRWVYTDVGWTWVSDEPYSWAVYHYGRWANIVGIGWIWVPDNEWGPAWVSWRRSPRYVGWAPLPPEARFVISIGFSNWVDSYYDIGPSRYRFVALNNFGARNLRTVFVPRTQNYTIINQTTNITNITYNNNQIFNRGPDFDEIARQSDRPIQRVRLDRRQDFAGDARSLSADDLKPRLEGESLRLFAPRVGNRAVGAPAKIARRVTDVEVNRGWKGGGLPKDESQRERLREKLRAEAKAPDALPEKPRFEPVAGPTTRGGAGAPTKGRPDATIPGAPTTTETTPGAPAKGRPGSTTATDDTTPDRPGRGRPTMPPGKTTAEDPTPGRGRPSTVPGRDPAVDPIPGKGRPGTTTDDTPGRPPGKGRPGATPGAPTTTDDTTPDRPGRGRPTMPPGKTTAEDPTPGRGRPSTVPGRDPTVDPIPGKGRPGLPGTSTTDDTPAGSTRGGRPGGAPRTNVDIPDRPSTPAVEPRPSIERRPATPRVERPETPARPAVPNVSRPSVPERPASPALRPAAPARPATAAPEARPAEPERPATPAVRPQNPRGGDPRKDKRERGEQ